MRDRKVSYFYFARAHSASLFFRAICVLFSLAFSVSFAAAQSNVDEGLPPGWQQWAADCGQTGQRDACYNEGLRHFWGAEGAPVDKAKAAHYFIIACKYNDIDVCRQAIKITRDEFQHVQRYGKALDAGCLLGELSFCHEAFQFYSGYGKFKKFSAATVKAAFNPNLALAYANAACQKGSVFGCTRLGRAFNADPEQNLKGIKPDSAKSMDGYMQACRLGSKEGCFFAFYASSGEDGAPVNVAVREAAMQIGCDKRSREL